MAKSNQTPAWIADSCSLSLEPTVCAGVCWVFEQWPAKPRLQHGGMTTTTSVTTYLSGYHGAGPLTTVFTTPDFCASLYWTDTVTPPLSSLVCMPPKFHQLYDYSFGFYSPGICPTGWSKGCEFANDRARTDDGGMVYFGGDVLAGETVRVCCPSGYTCLSNDPYSSSKCVRTEDSTTETAFALQVRWQESDLSILATDPTVPGSTYSAPSTATASQLTVQNTAVDTPTPSSSSGSTVAQNEDPGSGTEDGIPTGTIIGIVIGVGGMVVAFAVAAIIFFIWRHRRKRREENGTRVESMISGVGDAKPSPAKSGGFAPDNKAELDSRARASTLALSEAPADRDAIEMPPLHIAATEMEVPHFVAELPGSMPAGHDDSGQHTPETDVPRSPLPTAETSQRESGALGQMGHWKKRSVARSQSQLRPISRSSTSASSTTTTTTEDRRQNQT